MSLVLNRIFSVLTVLDRLEKGQRLIMAAIDDIQGKLSEMDSHIQEIATDLEDLVGKIIVGGLSPEEVEKVKVTIDEKIAALKKVASIHTPEIVPPGDLGEVK